MLGGSRRPAAACFVFRGGVIMIANAPLADLPELRALPTRIALVKLDVSDAELEALMRDLAARGHSDGKHVPAGRLRPRPIDPAAHQPEQTALPLLSRHNLPERP
jgi:hypothetical protein